MDKHILLKQFINRHPEAVGKVIDYNPETDRLLKLDFTADNTELRIQDIADTEVFISYINKKLADQQCRYGIGGYMEHRTLYAVSNLFNTGEEPRRLHLGVDIWADAGTPVYAPLNGRIHSFNDNNNLGDYGPTIILVHNLDGLKLFSLYGHLSRKDLEGIREGDIIEKNQIIGSFGNSDENGRWPPHLHFQLMFDIGDHRGDYPGVGQYSKKEGYLANIPDPDLILKFPGIN